MLGSSDAATTDSDGKYSRRSVSQILRTNYRWGTRGGWVSYAALLSVLAAFWAVGGYWGILAWIITVLCWITLPVILSVAVGGFALVAISPTEGGLIMSLLGQVSVFGLLLGDLIQDLVHPLYGYLFLGTVVTFGSGGLLLIQAVGLQYAIVGFAIAIVSMSYTLHRVLLLKIGDPAIDT